MYFFFRNTECEINLLIEYNTYIHQLKEILITPLNFIVAMHSRAHLNSDVTAHIRAVVMNTDVAGESLTKEYVTATITHNLHCIS